MNPLEIKPDTKQLSKLSLPDGVSTRSLAEAYLHQFTPEYYEIVKSLSQAIPEMRPDCRLSFAIPVAADEYKNVEKTLEGMLTKQKKSESLEAVVLINHRKDLREEAIRTKQYVEKFQESHPELNIHCLHVEMSAEFTIGYIRSLVTDVIVNRFLVRPSRADDHLISSGDADSCGHHQRFAETLVAFERMSKYQNTGMFVGKTSSSPADCFVDPLLVFNLMLNRSFGRWNHQRQKRIKPEGLIGKNPPACSGANSTFRLSSYCRVLGYPRDRQRGEDSGLKMRINEYHSQKRSYIPVARVRDSQVYVNARRIRETIKLGGAFCDRYAFQELQFGDYQPLTRMREDYTSSQFTHSLLDSGFLLKLNQVFNRTMHGFCGIRHPASPGKKKGIIDISELPDAVEAICNDLGIAYSMNERGEVALITDKTFSRSLLSERNDIVRIWSKSTGLNFKEFFSIED